MIYSAFWFCPSRLHASTELSVLKICFKKGKGDHFGVQRQKGQNGNGTSLTVCLIFLTLILRNRTGRHLDVVPFDVDVTSF